MHLVATVTDAREDEMTAAVEIVWDGKPRAGAVAHWKRWRPRPGQGADGSP